MIYAVPKPTYKKQRNAVNNPVPTAEDKCEICGAGFAALHECFFGKNRQNSIKYDMQKRLCYEHHQGDNGPHHNKVVDKLYKREAQAKFEMLHGSREDFTRIFGKNYLEVEE